jgi:hypothetical protein
MPHMVGETVRFRLAGGGNPLVLVPTYVNCAGPYDFILDTGASHSLISTSLAASLGIRAESERQGLGAGGAVTLALAHLDTIAVGAARRVHVQVGITSELAPVGAALRARVDGQRRFQLLEGFSRHS